MGRDDPLQRYNEKRDFTRTPEPAGTTAAPPGDSFVVQKHAATRLHWDFRLEVEGVLKSWAVTRGPSLDPEQKRLAVRTEDHPLSYAQFEGVIPKGEYGGGTVMLWDQGTWEPVAGKSVADLEKGRLHFRLHGERMRGEWMLIRLKPRPGERAENWLLRKVEDEHAGGAETLVENALTSISTGRTMAEIAENRPGAPVAPAPVPKPARTKKPSRRKLSGSPPSFRKPQLATLVDALPTGSAWVHEIKYDGYRAQLAIAGGRAVIYTRSGLDWTDKFPGIAEAAAALPIDSALIDGEVVALKSGKPDFSALKSAIATGGELTFFAFDLLELDGEDLTELALVERKAKLRRQLGRDPRLHFAEHIEGSGETLLRTLCDEGMEGIVSKRADARYVSGRSRAWLKVKCTRRQEFVIVGWLPSARTRGFRSLLLGVYRGGELVYAGKVGTGFDQATMDELSAAMAPLARNTPTVTASRNAVRGANWVAPNLVVEVAYTETTPDGVLRHPSFLGVREDKRAVEVVAEDPQASPTDAAMPAPIKITNPGRMAFPGAGVLKGDLAEYHRKLASLLLRWAGRRPLSLVRCPSGRGKQCFFQKHDAGSFGPAVHQIPIWEKEGGREPYLYVDDEAGLLACVQMGTIELHGWGASVDDVERPDRLVFDLDPDEALAFVDTKRAAVFLRDQLAGLGLASFALLSGGKGVHVVVPLAPRATWPEAKSFADRFARAMAQTQPDRFTATMAKAKRRGRIFIDWLRNQRGATAIMPYAVRARPGAPVAAPVTWRELNECVGANRWTVRDADELLRRARGRGLQGWGEADQVLPDV